MTEDTNNIQLENETSDYTGGLLKIGQEINGYKITQKLNTDSGEAELYFCEKKSKRYILKYYYKKTIYSDLSEKLLSLKHKNVMSILEIDKYKKHSYEIDEYYEGGSLDSVLPIAESEINNIIDQINEGLKAIHDAGILHRDIKAENIYFKDASRKEIVIGDFGISCVYDQKDNVNEHITQITSGTDGYKAPETFNGVISPAVDYYSFGILIWNLLTGKNPFVDENEDELSSEVIRYETLNEKILDRLLSNSPDLSERYKILISDLLVYRHDQRWRYNEVKDFLNGKEVTYIRNRRDLPAFNFGDKELFTLKSISEELLKNKELGIKLIKGSELNLYLDRNDLNELTAKIEKIQGTYLNKLIDDGFDDLLGGVDAVPDLEELALIKIAFTLCSNTTFPLTYCGNTYEIESLADFIDLLKYHSMAIRPYLNYECYGLYEKLSALTENDREGTFVKSIKEYVSLSTDDRILPISLYLNLTENKITPFKDKQNANIVLREKDDLLNLEPHLKERFMYLVDKKDKTVIAWIEKVFSVRMNDWYGELEGGVYHNEKISQLRRNKIKTFGKWEYFNLFLQGKDVIYREYFAGIGKIGLEDLNGDELWDAQFDDVHCEFIRDKYIFKIGNEWHVYVKREDDESGKYSSILSASGEISVVDEIRGIYQSEISDTRSQLWIEDSKGDMVDFILNVGSIGKIQVLNEVNAPCERIINKCDNHSDFLDSDWNKIDSFDALQFISADGDVPEKLTFWAMKNNRVFIMDKNCKVLKELPYTGFQYVGNNSFIVSDKEGIQSVVNYDGTVVREKVENYRSSGSIATIKRAYKAKWELLNLNNPDWALNGKKFKFVAYLGPSIFVSNSLKKYYFFVENDGVINKVVVKISGKGGTISDSFGLSKSFNAINSFTFLRALKPQDNDSTFHEILGFDGKAFYKYDFNSHSLKEIFSTRNVYDSEFVDLMNNVKSSQIINLVKKQLRNKAIESAHEIINLTWEYYYNRNDFNTSRFLLSSTRMDESAGLDNEYLFYKNRLGNSYINENKTLESSYKTKDMIRKNLNYSYALVYLLAAAGKDIDVNGEIITAPYLQNLDLNPHLVLDCAEICVDVSNVKSNIYFYYGWTKEYLRGVAFGMIQLLYDFFTDNKAVNSQTYMYINKLGCLFEKMGDLQNAIIVFQEGKKYEPDFHPINQLDLFKIYYNTNQYREAISCYDHLKNIIPSFLENSDYEKCYLECRRHEGI